MRHCIRKRQQFAAPQTDRHDNRGTTGAFDAFTKGDGVNEGCQHPHVITAGWIATGAPMVLPDPAANDVATANDNGDGLLVITTAADNFVAYASQLFSSKNASQGAAASLAAASASPEIFNKIGAAVFAVFDMTRYRNRTLDLAS